MVHDWFRSIKAWFIEEYGRPQDDASNALVLSLMMYLGGWVAVYAMNTIQTLYYTDDWFWKGSPGFNRRGALDLCNSSKPILLAFPSSVSESLSSQDGVTNVIVGSYLTFCAILILTSKLGNPSVFPVTSGHFRTVFNTLRMFGPAIGTFFIPRVAYIGPSAVTTVGKQIINEGHILFALLSFTLSPIFELISGLLDMFFFFTHKPIGDNFIPFHASENEKGEKRREIIGIIYKFLWVVLTLLRISIAIFISFYLIEAFTNALKGSSNVPTDACGTLRTIRSYVLEKTMIGLLASMYVVLSVTQMCESSGQRISSFIYILPLLVICFIGLGKLFSAFADSTNTVNMKENYLRLLNIPESGFWSKDDRNLETFLKAYPHYEWILSNCTALLDLKTVPDNCIELPTYPPSEYCTPTI